MNFADTAKSSESPPEGAQTVDKSSRVVDGSFEVSNNRGYSFALFVCWMAVFVAVAGSVFFWLLNNSAKQAIKDKSDEKNQIISKIATPSLADVEVKAGVFKSAVNNLSAVSAKRYSVSTLMPKFYEKIATSIQISNISISTDGKISFDGKAPSYRAVADQMLLFKEWKVNSANIVKKIELTNLNQGVNEETKKIEVSYALSMVIDQTKSLTETPVTTDTTTSSDATVLDSLGGENATN